MIAPMVQITDPPAGVEFDHDVAVRARDGVVLRVNVFRPSVAGRYPVLLCAHPYDKDTMPRPRRGGGHTLPVQYRLLSQDESVRHSAWTSWEAPDPAFWVPRGYVLVNADLRGWGGSEGTGELFSEQEGADCHDLIEWAAEQDWSNGRIGMTGVSYLAISQWRAAATRPPHLHAINPWEGFTDAYRDFAFPGGIREDGFSVIWDLMLGRRSRSPVELRDAMMRRPLIDEWWTARNPALEQIEVPALICASFSDQCLHSRGSFEGFRRISSTRKWLYTHRGPKWATYYSAQALQVQARFFDHFLRGDDNGADGDPPVRIEIRSDAHSVAEVITADRWPPAGARPVSLYADAATSTLRSAGPQIDATRQARRGQIRFSYRFDRQTDVVGPMRLTLHLSAPADDITIFAGVQKLRDGKEVGFEGSYGFDHDMVAHGWLRASHRRISPVLATPDDDWWDVRHDHARSDPLVPGAVTRLDLSLLPSATRFDAADELVLVIADHWPLPVNPLVGTLPARYTSTRSAWTLHSGPAGHTTLVIPVLDGGPGGQEGTTNADR